MQGLVWLGVLVRTVGVVAACILIPGQIVVALLYLGGRRFFRMPITPLQELEWHFFFALVFLTIGAALLADRHVRIDIVRERLSERTRAKIEIAGFFLALMPCCIALVYFGGLGAWNAFIIGERSPAGLGLPWRWIVKSTIPIGGLLLFSAGLVITAHNIKKLRNAGDVPDRRETGNRNTP